MNASLGTLRTILFIRYISLWALATLLPAGCTPPAAPSVGPPAAAATSRSTADRDKLRQEIDEVLAATLQNRQLNTQDHGAWQILHGVLAYQRVFPVRIGHDGQFVPALDHALGGGSIVGWTFQPGDVLDPATGRRGLRALVEPGTRKGQGHADQWLAIMSQCQLPLEQTLRVGADTFTLRDLVEQVKRDLPYNAQQEWSWSLTGLSAYLPLDASWTAADGQTWDFPRMLAAEVEQDIDTSACGGTHRLMGMATAVKRYRKSGGELTGVWQTVQQTVDTAIQEALSYQNADGSFSAMYFSRPSATADTSIILGSTGHVLEFLTVAMDDEQLRHPQVELAARYLCDLFRATQDIPLECGALYHAAHGLVLYRQRMFGPQTYTFDPNLPPTSPVEAIKETSATSPR